MEIEVYETKEQMGQRAADYAAEGLNTTIQEKGEANLILATGASQFEMLEALTQKNVEWGKVTCFHLDEYVGMDDSHPASFCGYLRERFEEQIPTPVNAFHYVDGMAEDPEAECRRLGDIIRDHPIDVACIGIGENGHLAFNDPPADFETEEPFIVVELNEECRRQQLGEGWFQTLEDVPKKAISMSIKQIMKSDRLVVTCPDERKADAVKRTVNEKVSNECPATVLRQHPECILFLDENSASKLE
ncbi:MAG: glucosamine-6-phosphate deaminase [Planctomycetota bacterium]